MKRHHLFSPALLAVSLCAGLLATNVLRAATESFTTSIPASDGANAPTTASFSLPQFNTALGTLTGVEVDFTLNYQAVVDIVNFTGQAQSFTASSSVPIDMDTPSDPSLQLVLAAYSLSNSVGSAFAETPFAGPVQNGTFPFTPAPANFGPYEGNGNNSYTLSYGNGTYSATFTPGGTGAFVGGDANSSGSAEVTYTYTAVPEPSTWSLIAVAVGAGIFFVVVRARTEYKPA